MSFLLDDGLRQWFYTDPKVKAALPGLRSDVEMAKTSPTAAADTLLKFLQANQKITDRLTYAHRCLFIPS